MSGSGSGLSRLVSRGDTIAIPSLGVYVTIVERDGNKIRLNIITPREHKIEHVEGVLKGPSPREQRRHDKQSQRVVKQQP